MLERGQSVKRRRVAILRRIGKVLNTTWGPQPIISRYCDRPPSNT